MEKSTAHLQEEGGARLSLRPRVEGQAVKVAETVLKKRHDDLLEKAERAKNLRAAKRAKKLDLHTNKVKSAQYFVKRALEKMKDARRQRNQRKRPAKAQRDPGTRIYCVVRNHRRGGSKETVAALEELGLKRPYTCVLIANDEKATATLRKVDPFVFYGLPSLATVKRLFYTRACIKNSEGKRVPLSGNQIVEDAFGSLGLICVEDLLHEVWTRGPHFEAVMHRIGAFKLANIRHVEGLESKRMEYGFLGKRIDAKVAQLA